MVFEEKDIFTTRDDYRFRNECASYGLGISCLLLCDDAAIIKSPREGFYIFLDRNSYSTMGVERIPAGRTNADIDFDKDSTLYKNLYNMTSEEAGMVLPYPFQEMTLKQLTDLADRVEVVDRNNGYSYDLFVNEKRVEESREKADENSMLLGAAKYLAVKSDEYWHGVYRAMILEQKDGPGVVGVYKYLGDLMRSLNEYVDLCIKDGEAPRIDGAAAYLGYGKKEVDIYASELWCVLTVLLRAKGYDFESTSKIAKISSEEGKDLDQKAVRLLKVLEVPKSELRKRIEILDKERFRRTGNLEEFLSQKTNEVEKGQKKAKTKDEKSQ